MRAMKLCAFACVLASAVMAPRRAAADAIDDAYAAGSEAALRGDWSAAVEAWSTARALLPEPNAQIEYELGTAYAELGDFGRAIVHLRRALELPGEPETRARARRNLGIARRRAEVAAESQGLSISEQEGLAERVAKIAAGDLVAWITLLAAWLVVALVATSTLRPASRPAAIARSLALALAVSLAIAIPLHAITLARDAAFEPVIVIDQAVVLRDGPGSHRAEVVKLQAGCEGWVATRRGGWAQVHIRGVGEGWLPETALVATRPPSAPVRGGR